MKTSFLHNIAFKSIINIFCLPYVNFLLLKFQNFVLNTAGYNMHFQNSLNHIHIFLLYLVFIPFCFSHVSIFYISSRNSLLPKKLFNVSKYFSHKSRSFINFLTVHSHTIRHLIPLSCNSILTI